MEVTEVPTLQELAEPLRQPGALPDGVPLSIGLIATTDPAVLRDASRRADRDYFDAAIDANPANTAFIETHYENLAERLEAARREGLDGESTSAASVRDHPRLVEAREDLTNALVDRANAQLDLPILESGVQLRDEINRGVKHLGRASWLATTAAGLILGAGAALGLTLTHDTPTPATVTQSEQAHYENEAQAEKIAKVALPPASGALGAGIGFMIGMRFRGHVARMRARRLVRKASDLS